MTEQLDNEARYLIDEERHGIGWTIRSDDQWLDVPQEAVKPVLAYLGIKRAEIPATLGGLIRRPWTLTGNFGPEYPGGRIWNRHGYAPNCPLLRWARESVHAIDGAFETFADVEDAYLATRPRREWDEWKRKRLHAVLANHPHGRRPRGVDWGYGNLSLDSNTPPGPRLILKGDKLVPE